MAKLPIRKPDMGGLERRSYIAPSVLALSRQKTTKACAAPVKGQQSRPRDESRGLGTICPWTATEAAVRLKTAGIYCQTV